MAIKLIEWIGRMLSSSDSASFSRFASLLALVACITWDTAYIVFVMRHFGQFQFKASDLLAYGGVLMAQTGFCTAPYGVGKLFDKGAEAFGKDRQQ